MKEQDYGDYIQDIIDSVNDVESFIKGMIFEDFVRDRKTINAVIRSIEIIGEATKKIPKVIKDRYPSIPWKKMAGMRDKLAHEYSGVDVGILWKTVTEDIPMLKTRLQNIAESLKG